jgi:hypothetical protein
MPHAHPPITIQIAVRVSVPWLYRQRLASRPAYTGAFDASCVEVISVGQCDARDSANSARGRDVHARQIIHHLENSSLYNEENKARISALSVGSCKKLCPLHDRSFLHPEDSDNEKLHQFVREEEIRERDTDDDGKLSFVEFLGGMYDALRDLKVSLGVPPETPPRTAVFAILKRQSVVHNHSGS